MFDQRLSSRRSPYWVERGASRRQAKLEEMHDIAIGLFINRSEFGINI